MPLLVSALIPQARRAAQQELLAGKFSLACTFARDQVKKGASIIDVNVGMPGLDETATLFQAVRQITLSTEAPLCLDTSRLIPLRLP